MIRKIPLTEVNEYAKPWGFQISTEEMGEFRQLVDIIGEIVDGADSITIPDSPLVPATRQVGARPTSTEDPYNAIVRWCSVKADDSSGPLSGLRLGVKDSIAIAQVPLTGGSKLLQDFVPTIDSTVTQRLLEAGAEIVAITNMDDLAFSGGGDSSAYGATLCPYDLGRTAGGSSGGSAAAIHYDKVDASIGTDQGGSIRVPSAWCGVLGLKPSFGLVPYPGILGIDQPIDHVGPIARTSTDLARLLQVIAGADPSDPRQYGEIPQRDFNRAVSEAPADLHGLRIGLVVEGFGSEVGTEPSVDTTVRAAIHQLTELGATVHDVSIPEHLSAGSIVFGTMPEAFAALCAGGGNGHHWQGRYWPELAPTLKSGLERYSDELSTQVKLALVFGSYMQKQYGGAQYAKLSNLRSVIRDAYDRALAGCDVLIMPTTPGLPHLNDPSLNLVDRVMRGWGVLSNTSATDISGHPALSLPMSEVDGLPVGVMAIAPRFADDRLISLARTIETQLGWKPTPAS